MIAPAGGPCTPVYEDAMRKKPLIGPVAWYIYQLTGSFPQDYRCEPGGGTAGTFRGHPYKAWLGTNNQPYVYVDEIRVKVSVYEPKRSWTRSKCIAWAILQHVEEIEKEVAA